MPRLVHLLDRWIDIGIVVVLTFTPLAFGSVEPWAQSVGQAMIWTIFFAWLIKLAWTPELPKSRRPEKSYWGGRLRRTGLELPALLFAIVLLLQLVPLPQKLINLVSPKTSEIFALSLPYYGQAGEGSFRNLPTWLQSDPNATAGEVPALPADASALDGAIPLEAFDEAYASPRPLSLTPSDTARGLGVYLVHLALFMVVFHQLDRRKGATRWGFLLAALVGLLAGIGILQSLTSDGKLYWWRGGGPHHSFGPFVNANNFAGWMEMALPVVIGTTIALWVGTRRRGDRGPSGAAVLLSAFVSILGLTAFVLAMSRGGFLALFGAAAIALLVLALRRRIRPGMVALALIPVVAALGLAAWIDLEGLTERYGTLTDVQEERSFTTRLDFSKRALTMASDFPVLGSGFGSFREAHYLYSPGTSNQELARAHNDYAQLAAECGFLGLFAMLWALWVVVRRGVGTGLLSRRNVAPYTLQGAAIGVIALLLHSFVDFNLQIYSNSLLFVFLVALLMRAAADREAEA